MNEKKCALAVKIRKQRLVTVQAFKAKSESFDHAVMKADICDYFTNKSKDYTVDTEVQVENIGVADVVVYFGDVAFAFECGDTEPEKIEALKTVFDEVIHIPYCYTRKYVQIDFDEIARQFMVHAIIKDLQTRGHKVEFGVPICLENCPDCSNDRKQDFWNKAVNEVLKTEDS